MIKTLTITPKQLRTIYLNAMWINKITIIIYCKTLNVSFINLLYNDVINISYINKYRVNIFSACKSFKVCLSTTLSWKRVHIILDATTWLNN